MVIKNVYSSLYILTGASGLLLFSSAVFAASVDTTKIQPKVVNIPAPAVKAPIPIQSQTTPGVMVRPTGPQRGSSAASPVIKPKQTIKTPTKNIKQKTVKVPVQTTYPAISLDDGETLKTPGKPSYSGMPKVQPNAKTVTPGQKLKPGLNYRAAPRPVFQPRANMAMPSQNLKPGLNSRYAPPGAIAKPGSAGNGGREHGYSNYGDGTRSYDRSAYNPATARLPTNPANPIPIPYPNTSTAGQKVKPGLNSRAPLATSKIPAINGIGGSRVDSQTLGRIQEFGEAAKNAQELKNINEIRNAQDIQNIGAAQRGFGGDQAGPLGDGGIGLGAISGEGSNGPDSSGSRPGMGAFDRSSSADPAAGYNSGAYGGSNFGTNKDKSGFTGRQFGRNSNGGIDFKGSYSHDNGSTSTVIISTADDGAGNSRQTTSVVTTDANGDITAQRDTVRVTASGGEPRTISDTSTGDQSNSSDSAEAYRAGTASVNQSTGNTEEAGEKKVGQSSEVDQGGGDSCGRRDVTTGKCYDSKPTMGQMTGQKARDGGGEGTSAPVVGPIAVTNEDEFHSRGGGGGRKGNVKDWATDPPEEGAEIEGIVPPTPGG